MYSSNTKRQISNPETHGINKFDWLIQECVRPGDKFLYWHDLRRWRESDFEAVPIQSGQYKKLRLAGYHFKGCLRGITNTMQAVPFIAIDADRHTGQKSAAEHIDDCLKIIHLIAQTDLHWIAEINKRNGSVKFYGFLVYRRKVKPIDTESAKAFAANFLKKLEQVGCSEDITIFPDMRSCSLPLIPHKANVGANGVFSKAIKKRRDPYGTGKMVPYEYHSMVEFWDSVENHKMFDVSVFILKLKKACSRLEDEEFSVVRKQSKWPTATTDQGQSFKSRDHQDLTSEWQRGGGNAFLRDKYLTAALVRQSNGKIDLKSCVKAKEDADCFTGVFDEVAAKERIGYWLKKFRASFKNEGRKLVVPKQVRRIWQRDLVVWSKKQDIRFDENGMPVAESKVKVQRVKKEQARELTTAIFDCISARDDNDGVSTSFVEYTMKHNFGWWSFNKYKLVRDWLESEGLIHIYDKKHTTGKCWRWKPVVKQNRSHGFRKPVVAISYPPPLISLFHHECHLLTDSQSIGGRPPPSF